jgi:hypothetical protein
MAQRYNKWGAAHKNITQFDVEPILHKDENAVAFRIYSNKDEFLLYFTPNYENKTVEVGTDRNTKFSDATLEFLVNSGDVENIMKQVYTKAFIEVPADNQPQQVPLNLPDFSNLSLIN